MEHYWLLAAAIFFLLSFGHTVFALTSGTFRPGRFNLAAMSAGFLCVTAFLYLRGQQVRACPITTLPEVLIFLSWSIVLLYVLVGPAFRLSLMGAFTSPVVLALLALGLTLPGTPAPRVLHNPWIESHAALSIIAYGAFGLAGISGAMYLVQERQLKSRKVSELLLNLPPITELGKITARLLFIGLALLTVAFAAGLVAGLPTSNMKTWTSVAIWVLYAALLGVSRVLPARRTAAGAIGAFVIALLALPGIQYLSTLAQR